MSYLYDGATPWTRSRLRAVKAHGGVAVSVYVVGSPGGMRCANRADVALARSMGLGVYPNWERAADFFKHCTIAQARQAGVEALTACRDLGFPDGTTVAFSFDYEIDPADYPNAAARLVAANQGFGGHYRAVAYGQAGFIAYLAAHGQPGPHWLMGSTFRASSQFTPAEVGSPHVAMVQMHDAHGNWLSSPVGGTDINTLTQPGRLGAWWPDNSNYAVEADMPLTDQDIQKIANAVWAKRFTDPTDPSGKATFPASSWLVYGNRFAQAASKVQTAAVDAAAVVEGVWTRFTQRIGGTQ